MCDVVRGNVDRGVVTPGIAGCDDPVEGDVGVDGPGHLTLEHQVLVLGQPDDLAHIPHTVRSS